MIWSQQSKFFIKAKKKENIFKIKNKNFTKSNILNLYSKF